MTELQSLVVEWVVPHYFASLFASILPDEHGGLGGAVYMIEEPKGPYIGDITFIENNNGQWLIDVTEDDHILVRTFVENVERIVIT